ncbi:MAG: hypothetical protein WCV90_07530 [Candidatus Woesearchaeota archaeon]
MSSIVDLEAILDRFESHRELFRYPFTLSLENQGVVGKYIYSMLKVADKKEYDSQGVSSETIIKRFCERYNSDETEMRNLLSDPENNWFDYRLYTCFRSFIQRELGLDTETLFRETTELSFTDKDSKHLSSARYIPLSWVLSFMDKQFPNFSRVNQVKVEKMRKGRVRIYRKTWDYHKKELLNIIGPELTLSALRDDCEFTRHSFITTFQQLYGQKDLQVVRERSEADEERAVFSLINKQPLPPRLITENPKSWAIWESQESQESSIYLVSPSKPYRSILFGWLESIGEVIDHIFPWSRNKQLERENEDMKTELFMHRNTVLEKTEELVQRTVESMRNLQLVGGLAEELAAVRSAGESHYLKNRLQSVLVSQEEHNVRQMAQAISFATNIPLLDPELQKKVSAYLVEASTCFGVQVEDLRSPESLIHALRKVDVTLNTDSHQVTMDEEVALLFEALSGVRLDESYTRFKEVQQRYKETYPNVPLFDFNPFELFYSLREIQEGIALARDRITRLGKMESIKEVRFSEALEEAIEMVCSDKSLPYDKKEIITEVEYDPNFYTIKDLLIFTLKDLLNNGKKAGSPQMRVATINPNRFKTIESLPLFEQFSFSTFPSLYLMVENFFPNMTLSSYAQLKQKAEELNAALKGEVKDAADISTTLMGGQGTPYLINFYRIHHGQGRYEASLEGKSMIFHSYFTKLGM